RVRRVLPVRAILLSEFWAAFGYIAFLIWPSVYVLAGAFAAQAFCFPNTDSAITAYNYALIPDRLLGRALSVGDTLRIIGAPLGPLAAGLLLASVSPRATIAVLAGATLAVTLPGTLSPSIRETPALEALTAVPPRRAAAPADGRRWATVAWGPAAGAAAARGSPHSGWRP